MKPMNGHLGLISLPSTSESPFDCSSNDSLPEARISGFFYLKNTHKKLMTKIVTIIMYFQTNIILIRNEMKVRKTKRLRKD